MVENNSTEDEKIVKSGSEEIETVKSGYLSRALELLQEVSSSDISVKDSSTDIEQTNGESSSLACQSDDANLALEFDESYRQLRYFLSNKQWLDADNETKEIIMRLCGRQKQDWIRIKDLKKLTCNDLKTIDQLWMEYSSDRFGISVQKELFKKFWDGGPSIDYHSRWCKFGELLGWRSRGGSWSKATTDSDGWVGTLADKLVSEDKQYSKPQESNNFPVGHFPRICRLRVGGLVWWAGAPRFPWGAVYCALMLRFQQCDPVQE